jgi:hypothetical protein
MWHKLVSLLTLLAVAAAPSLLAAEAQGLSPIVCASPAEPVKVSATVPASATSARIYFKAEGQTAEYYSDMRRGPNGSMWGFIPAPEATTTSFTYRVVSSDAKTSQSSSMLIASVLGACPPQALTTTEQMAASAMVLGLTNDSQSAVPPGFQCKGIVSLITANGELRPNDECRRVLAGLPAQPGAAAAGTSGATGAGGSAVGGGLSNRTIIALTAAGLLGVGAVIISNNGDSDEQVSPSRP